MSRTNFEPLEVYQRKLLSEDQVQRLKPPMDELAPRLNAYLKAIGHVPDKNNNGQRTTNNRPA